MMCTGDVNRQGGDDDPDMTACHIHVFYCSYKALYGVTSSYMALNGPDDYAL
jgi:hypothetical protein